MSKRTEIAFQTTGEVLVQLPNPLAVAERAASFFSEIPSSSAQLAVALILVLLAYNMIAGSVVGALGFEPRASRLRFRQLTRAQAAYHNHARLRPQES